MKKVQHKIANITKFYNSATSNSAILKATALKSATSLVCKIWV